MISNGQFRAVDSTLFVLTWVTLIIRYYVRIRVLKSFGWDDRVILLALISYTFMVVSSFANTYDVSNITRTLKLLLMGEVAYALAIDFTKAAIVLFLLRVVVHQWQRWILWVTMAIEFTYGIAFFFLNLFQCIPVSKFWNPATPGKCTNPWNLVYVGYANAAVCVAADFTLAILPIFIVRELNLPVRTKMAAAFVLMLGTFASIATILRIPDIHYLAAKPITPMSRIAIGDALSRIALWSTVEPGVGIIVANMATFRPLLHRIPLFRSQEDSSGPDNTMQEAKERKRPQLYPSVDSKNESKERLPEKPHDIEHANTFYVAQVSSSSSGDAANAAPATEKKP